MLSKSAKGIVCSSETQILWLVWDTKAVSSLTLLIVVVEDWQRQVVVCSQVFINSVLGWLDVLGLEKAVVILTYIVLDIEPGWNKFCFQSSSCVWMISRLNQDSLKTVLCFPKQQWSLQVFFLFGLVFGLCNSPSDILMCNIPVLVPCSKGKFCEGAEDRENC